MLFGPAKAISGSSDTIRQTEEKFREYGGYGVWIFVVTYVKCQQTLGILIYYEYNKYKQDVPE
jgi:hypothetical protein